MVLKTLTNSSEVKFEESKNELNAKTQNVENNN
jgi:hypothetical protein